MIIGFSGKAQSGKDTSGMIAQILLNSPHLSNVGVKDFLRKQVDPEGTYYSQWEIKKFADKLKEIVALLIGCTRDQLENETFKSTELSKEWWYYKTGGKIYPLTQWTGVDKQIADSRFLVKTTPRLLLQLMGTECGREILHPQIWVNSTLANYKSYSARGSDYEFEESKWIITDMRFPNELEAIKAKGGITIRINRKAAKVELAPGEVEHPSETALDRANFDYTLDNDASIDDLIDCIRLILSNEGLLTKN